MFQRSTTFCGTLEYMAPEMMRNTNYGDSVDWFSFGILLFEMLCGKNPFKNENQEPINPDEVPEKIEQILEGEQELLAGHENTFSPEAYDLLEKLLRYDPEYRIGCRDAGVQEIKEHPFFSGVDWHLIERKGMVAPFVPVTKDVDDVSNFQTTFTNMPVECTPTDKRFSEMFADQVQFSNFSYVHNEMSQHRNQARQQTTNQVLEDTIRNDSV